MKEFQRHEAGPSEHFHVLKVRSEFNSKLSGNTNRSMNHFLPAAWLYTHNWPCTLHADAVISFRILAKCGLLRIFKSYFGSSLQRWGHQLLFSTCIGFSSLTKESTVKFIHQQMWHIWVVCQWICIYLIMIHIQHTMSCWYHLSCFWQKKNPEKAKVSIIFGILNVCSHWQFLHEANDIVLKESFIC